MPANAKRCERCSRPGATSHTITLTFDSSDGANREEVTYNLCASCFQRAEQQPGVNCEQFFDVELVRVEREGAS